MLAAFKSTFTPFKKALRPVFKVKRACDKSAKGLVPKTSQGKVFIVGAGCGDPDLLTIKALKAIKAADVVLVDWLVNREIYRLFSSQAQVVFVGKKCGKHSMTQAKICNLMLELALAGKTVVRLKGGDPSLFGRLSEETQILEENNVDFCVVPGVTAASGCAAYSGIPLTSRDYAKSVRFLTAHLQKEDDDSWLIGVQPDETLVFYMGLSRVKAISQKLQKLGMTTDMPIAIIDQGTLSEQIIVCSTLGEISEEGRLSELKGPALVVVGEVVKRQANVNAELLHQLSKTSIEACL